MRRVPPLWLAAALGGALGALARLGVTTAFPADPTDFQWATLAINVSGSFLLALLPAIALIRESTWLTVMAGPGVLGGYTTLSAYSEQTRALLASDQVLLAAVYVFGTLALCLIAVALASRVTTLTERWQFRVEGGDE
ncbi:MAG: CrcB family protein [Nocardioidaceae bacterium]|nr:MAG: CrcB family protein [Nocardioidaceae bacterium]